MSRRFLAADVGGTNMRFLLVDDGREVSHRIFATRDYRDGGVARAVRDFIGDEKMPDAFCLACAGVVRDGRYHGHNMPFSVSASEVAAATGIAKVKLLNDLEAAAYGLPRTRPSDFVDIMTGAADPAAPEILMAVGTGLGGALRLPLSNGTHVLPCEPGQTGYAPLSPIHAELFLFATEEIGRTPIVEEIVSGPGLHRTYRFVRTKRGLAREGGHADAAAVSQAALTGFDPDAREAMRLLVAGLGFVIRNFAAQTNAVGGVTLAGGVAEKIAPALVWPEFADAIAAANGDKLLPKLPIRLVKSDRMGLDGALEFAASI